MSSGVLGYHEMYITEIAECIRKIYVKQKEKKWVAWVQNGDIYFSPHTQEVLVVYNAVNPQLYKKALQSHYIGSVKPFYIAAWLFPKNCANAAVLAVALSSLVVRLFFGCGYAAAPKPRNYLNMAILK